MSLFFTKKDDPSKKLNKKDADKYFMKGQGDKVFNTSLGDAQANVHLVAGPKVKNQATYDFEYIIRELLKGTQQCTFELQNKTYSVKIGDETFNLSEILKKADMQHLEFHTPEFNHYVSYVLSDESKNKPLRPFLSTLADKAYFLSKDKKGTLKDLDYAEMAAINIYTQKYYQQMNSILRGSTAHKDFSTQNPDFQKNMKEVLLHVAMCSSGLSKTPDTHIQDSYRFDGKLPQTVINNRMKSINATSPQPDSSEVTTEAGFISTGAKAASAFKAQFRTVFTGLVGKDISALSFYPHEKEFLIPPTQMKWVLHHKVEGDEYFLATPVNTPIGEKVKAGMGTSRKQFDDIVAEEDHRMVQRLLSFATTVVDGYEKQKTPQHSFDLMHSWRKYQTKTLKEKIQDLSNNQLLSPDEKCNKLKELLNKTDIQIQQQKKLPLTSQQSRLEDELKKIWKEHDRERGLLQKFVQDYSPSPNTNKATK